MTNSPQSNDDQRRKVLLTTRIICISMLVGELIFLVIVLSLRERGQTPANPEMGRMMFYIAGAMVVTASVMGFVLRRAIWGARPVAPGKFTTGHILFQGIVEGATFFGIVAIMMGAPVMPAIAVPVIGMAVQAINFPTMGPMET